MAELLHAAVETGVAATLAAWFTWDYARAGRSRREAVTLSVSAVVLGFAAGDALFALIGGAP